MENENNKSYCAKLSHEALKSQMVCYYKYLKGKLVHLGSDFLQLQVEFASVVRCIVPPKLPTNTPIISFLYESPKFVEK